MQPEPHASRHFTLSAWFLHSPSMPLALLFFYSKELVHPPPQKPESSVIIHFHVVPIPFAVMFSIDQRIVLYNPHSW